MTKKQKNEPEALTVKKRSVGWMFKMLCTHFDAEMTRELGKLNIKKNEFGVLMTLLNTQGITQIEIAKSIVMPGYATSRTLDSLEEKGLVERRADENSRRSFRIFLTKKGESLGPELFKIIGKVNKRFMADLNPTEQKQLTSILTKLLSRKFELD